MNYLALASAGVNILGGFLQAKAAGRQAAAEVFDTVFSGGMERMQIRSSAREDARVRAQELQRVLGAQGAAFGAQGIAGGRSATLMGTLSRTAAMREQSVADEQTRLQLAASVHRQGQGVGAARTSRKAGARQGLISAAGGTVDLFRAARTSTQQTEAMR